MSRFRPSRSRRELTLSFSGLVDRLVRQETQRNTCHLGPGGIPDHPESRGPGIDGLHASHQLIRTIGIRTVKAVVPAPFALIKHHVKEGRQCRIRAAVEPDLNGVQIRGIAEYLLLLRGAQRDVRAPAIGPPALYARANAEARVGKGDALVDFVLVGVGWRSGIGISNGPKVFDELVPR